MKHWHEVLEKDHIMVLFTASYLIHVLGVYQKDWQLLMSGFQVEGSCVLVDCRV